MRSEFKMPSLGADMDTGTLIEWLVSPGDRVEKGAIVAVVETQKGAIDIEIYDAGVISSLEVEVGVEVPVGTVLATLDVEAGSVRSVASEAPEAPPPVADVPPSTRAASPMARRKVSPRAKRLAAELGVDPTTLQGTGPQGSVTADDVERAAPRSKPTAPNAMRAAIAAAMTRANREIPHYYLQHTIDLEPSLSWLEAENRERSVQARVLPVALLVRAVTRALSAWPQLNGWYRDGAFVAGPAINVGLAVALRDGGLVNPAVRDAGEGSLVDLWAKLRDVTQRARSGSLRASELSEATITVSSLGDRGVDVVHGVIHPPQVALVGFGAIRIRPWVVEGEVQPRRLVEASLAADHRVTDGHQGARFLHHIGRVLAQPEKL